MTAPDSFSNQLANYYKAEASRRKWYGGSAGPVADVGYPAGTAITSDFLGAGWPDSASYGTGQNASETGNPLSAQAAAEATMSPDAGTGDSGSASSGPII